jgi:hypothetical protein
MPTTTGANDSMSLLIVGLFGGIVSKIIWDWLSNKGRTDFCSRHSAIEKSIEDMRHTVGEYHLLVMTQIESIKSDIRHISKRLDSNGFFKEK